MPAAENSIVINRPRSDVFAFVADHENDPKWRPGVLDIKRASGEGQGAVYTQGVQGPMGRRIDADFAQVLIARARRLSLADGFGAQLKQTAYALDSTTIDLCLSLFPWARFRRHKAAVKMHTLLDLHGSIPTFTALQKGKRTTSIFSTSSLPRRVRTT